MSRFDFNSAAGFASYLCVETMDSSLHRAGNAGIDADGKPDPNNQWLSAKGKRWSAWYNEKVTHSLSDGKLIMGGGCDLALDQTRNSYCKDDIPQPYHEYRLHTCFLETFRRQYSDAHGFHIEAPDSPGILISPKSQIKIVFDASQMATRGFRASAWLMPAELRGDEVIMPNAYDGNAATGAEIDLFEIEPQETQNGPQIKAILCKVIAGDSLTTPNDHIPVNLSSGIHTLTLTWEKKDLVWELDNKVIQTDWTLVPQGSHYLILSREMNSGLKASESVPPYRPQDDGLYGNSVIEDKHLINNDKFIVHSVEIM